MWRWGWILREGESCVRVETGTSLCSSNLSPSPSCETSSPQPGAPSPQHGDHHLSLSHHHLRVGAIPSGRAPSPHRAPQPSPPSPKGWGRRGGTREPLPGPRLPSLPLKHRLSPPGDARGLARAAQEALSETAAERRRSPIALLSLGPAVWVSAPAPAPLPQRSRGGEEGGGCCGGSRAAGVPCRGPRKEPGERVCGVSLPPPLVSFALKCHLEQGGERVSLLLLFICVLFYEGVRCLATWVAAWATRMWVSLGCVLYGGAPAGPEPPG